MALPDAIALFESQEQERWSSALEQYPSIIEHQEIPNLRELDLWYRTELPTMLAGRDPTFLERDELIQVVRWKMRRGEWRARNLALVQSNSMDEVREASTESFGLLDAPRRALNAFCRLAG